ncbi:amidohydrolase [Cupriavidus necator]|uniref:M20 metallopeptidase family protein n=1 Tax=Cupriavidus necator TaxID=106590 RepID=UPI0039C0B877
MQREVTSKIRVGPRRYPLLKWIVSASLSVIAGSASADPTLLDQALSYADATEQQVISWRRHIHQHPELPWQEKETAKYIADALARMPGFQVQTGIAGTGIKAVLRGGKPGPVVAFRADMDGLPVQERNALPFKSTVKATYQGKETHVAHACGHDTHVAMLLGAAQVFSSIQKDLPGTVVLLFQPAEEGGPGNGGAVRMLAAGVLDHPKVDLILGQHISARAPSGSISYRPGDFLAGASNFKIKLTGKGGHGSSPWEANDPVIAAAEVVLALQSIVSHQLDQQAGNTTLTVGMLQSGVKMNILPESAEIGGTIRSLSRDNLATAGESLQRRVKSIADGWRLTSKVEVGSGGYDNVFNDPKVTKLLIPAFKAAAGADHAIEGKPLMGSDDFGAFASNGVPAVYWFLNASPFGARPGAPNHSPDFVIDESAMRVGVRAFVATAMQFMNAKTQR